MLVLCVENPRNVCAGPLIVRSIGEARRVIRSRWWARLALQPPHGEMGFYHSIIENLDLIALHERLRDWARAHCASVQHRTAAGHARAAIPSEAMFTTSVFSTVRPLNPCR